MSFQTEREMLFLERNRYIQVCRENEYAVLYYDNKEEKIIRYKTGKKFSFSLKRNRYIQVCRENEYAVLYYDNKEEKIIRYKTGKKFSFSLKYQLCILVTLVYYFLKMT